MLISKVLSHKTLEYDVIGLGTKTYIAFLCLSASATKHTAALPYCNLSVCKLINALLHLNCITSDVGRLVSRYFHIFVFSNMCLMLLHS